MTKQITPEQAQLISDWHADTLTIASAVCRRRGIISQLKDFLPFAEDALIYSVQTFDETKGMKFHSYLFTNIDFIVDKFREKTNHVVQCHMQRQRAVYKAGLALGLDYNDDSNDAAIAAYMGITEKVLKARKRAFRTSYNLAHPAQPLQLTPEGNRADETLFIDLAMNRFIDHLVNRSYCERLMLCLNERQQYVITQRYVHERSLRDIARDLGVTFQAVALTEKTALIRLRSKALALETPQKQAAILETAQLELPLTTLRLAVNKKERCLKLLDKGMSYREAAKAVGIHRATAISWRKAQRAQAKQVKDLQQAQLTA